jgi:Sulfotransferase family
MLELADYQGQNLVFVVGSPRSGTSWLQRMLSFHPKVRAGTESMVFYNYVGPQLRAWRNEMRILQKGRDRINGLAAYFRDQEYREILREYMLSLLTPMIANLGPGEVFVEKTPGHAIFIGEIIEMLPKCRIVHIMRDARDVVASMVAAGDSWAKGSFPTTTTAAALMWVEHVESVRKAVKRVPRGQFYELTYERLFYNTAELLNDVWRFIGVQSDLEEATSVAKANTAEELRRDGAFNFPIGGEIALRSGPVAKVPQGFINSPEPGRWKRDLSAFDKVRVWRVARKTMRSVGYAWNYPY